MENIGSIEHLSYEEKLKKKISNLSSRVWHVEINNPQIESWLGNYQALSVNIETERKHALYLLSQFMYFDIKQIRALLKNLYKDRIRGAKIREIRKFFEDSKDSKLIHDEYNNILSKTRFLGVGNPSESGTHLLYYFRQESELGKDYFINNHELFKTDRTNGVLRKVLKDDGLKSIIYIDDVLGSGTQVLEYLTETISDLKTLNPELKISYYTLFASEKGIVKIKDSKLFDRVESIFTLDSSFKVFSHDSRYFSELYDINVDKSIARDFVEKYSKDVLNFNDEHCFGYKDGQLLLGFYYNTPDNTLPIMWCDNINWTPIFKRYDKKYGVLK